MEPARVRHEQNHVSLPIPNMLADRILKCKSCGQTLSLPQANSSCCSFANYSAPPTSADKCGRCRP